MHPVRVLFDVTLPVVTTAAFAVGERSFVDGEQFPWRELGVNEWELQALWRANYIRFVPAGETVAFVATPGEMVAVDPPPSEPAPASAPTSSKQPHKRR